MCFENVFRNNQLFYMAYIKDRRTGLTPALQGDSLEWSLFSAGITASKFILKTGLN